MSNPCRTKRKRSTGVQQKACTLVLSTRTPCATMMAGWLAHLAILHMSPWTCKRWRQTCNTKIIFHQSLVTICPQSWCEKRMSVAFESRRIELSMNLLEPCGINKAELLLAGKYAPMRSLSLQSDWYNSGRGEPFVPRQIRHRSASQFQAESSCWKVLFKLNGDEINPVTSRVRFALNSDTWHIFFSILHDLPDG